LRPQPEPKHRVECIRIDVTRVFTLADNSQLRRELRQTRQSLTPADLHEANNRLFDQLVQERTFLNAKRVAAYVGSKGEIDPMPLLQIAHDMGKQCYLPVLHPFLAGRLWFARWSPQHDMRFNHFNIPEPVFRAAECCAPQFLNLVLVPLLGFDKHCHRLGMGGGYYDRTLAYRRRRHTWKGPTLFGLAHEHQRVEALQVQPWDISLDRIYTGTAVYSQ